MPIIVTIEGHPNLEFPDGTTQEVIQAKVKEIVSGGNIPSETPPVDDTTPVASPTPSVPVEGQDTLPPVEGQEEGSSTLMQDLPAMIGATALGVGVGLAGGTLVPIVSAAALGGAGGEGIHQIGQHIVGSPNAPKTSIEAAKRIGMLGLEQGAWELVGGLAWQGLAKLMAPFKPSVSKGAVAAKEFFKDRIKPVFLPAEATDSRVLDLLHNVAESSIIGGNTITKYKVARDQFFDEYADNLIAQFGDRVDPTDLGSLFVKSIENGKEVHGAAAKVLYNNVSDIVAPKVVKVAKTSLAPSEVLGPGGEPIMKSVTTMVDETVDVVNISTKGLKEFASRIKAASADLGGIEAKNAGDDLVAAVMDLPNTVGFETAKELRSRLLSRIDEFSVMNKKAPAIGKARKMIGLMDEQISAALKEFDSVNKLKGEESAHDAWRLANRFYKEGQERLNNTMIRRLMKFADDTGTGSEMIAPAIFKPGQVSRVQKVKKAVDAKTWGKLQGYFMEHFLQKSTDVNGAIVGKRIINNISGKPGSFGEPMLREILSPEQINGLKNFGKAVQLTQQRQSEGAGRVLIQLTQAGAIAALASGKAEIASSAIILGPPILSKMMLNPTTNKLLTEGITMPIGSRAAAGLMARISGEAAKIAIKQNGEDDR